MGEPLWCNKYIFFEFICSQSAGLNKNVGKHTSGNVAVTHPVMTTHPVSMQGKVVQRQRGGPL